MPSVKEIETSSLLLIGHVRKRGRVTEHILQQEWRIVDMKRRRQERLLKATMDSLFEAQRRAIIKEIQRIGSTQLRSFEPTAGLVEKSILAANHIFHMSLWDQELENRFTPPLLESIEEGFMTALARIGIRGVAFSQTLPQARINLLATLEKTKNVNTTTVRTLGDIIDTWIQSGEGESALVKQITAAFSEFSSSRALTIGRTAALSSFEGGQLAGYMAAGIEKKTWFTMRDERVRSRHRPAHGETVALHEPFLKTGEAMQHPGDPAGSAKNVIRCRCTSIPEL